MSDYKEKPKRQPFQERPFLYLAVGILIGIIVAAIGFVAFFMIAGSETQVSQVIVPSPVVAQLQATPTLVAPPVGVQRLQPTAPPPMPTVVSNRIQSARISPDGNFIAVISVDNGLSTILLNQFRPEIELQAPLYTEAGYFNDAVFSPDGRYLMVTVDQFTGPSAALLFDVQTREILDRFPQLHAAAFSPDSTRLVLVGASTGIRIIDTTNRSLIASQQLDASYVQAVAYSSQNQIAIAADSQVVVYDANNLSTPPGIVCSPGNFVYAVAFHPDGEYLAVASDYTVQVIHISTGEITQYNIDARQIFSVAFSADGEWLAVGGGDSGIGVARLLAFRWNASNVIPPDPNFYTPISLTGHQHIVSDVMFTPDGNLLSASWDGTVRLWNLETQSEISQMGY